MGTDSIVGYAHGHPYNTLAARSLSHHLHYPCLVGVTDGEGLALRAVAIGLCKGCHHADGLTGSLGTLESNIYERAIVEYAGVIDHLFPSAISSLPNSYLILVDVSNNVVRFLCLRNFSMIDMSVPIYDLAHSTLGMLGGRIVAQSDEHTVVICIIRTHHRTVCGGFLSDNEIGTCVRSLCHQCEGGNCEGAHETVGIFS